jgi:gliding motility associated protien GldN
MKAVINLIVLLGFMLGLAVTAEAQLPEDVQTEGTNIEGEAPIDGIVERHIVEERRVLPFVQVREADIFWEKKVWRVIDTREKMNKPFVYPERPMFSIVKDAVLNGELVAYSVENDKFTQPISIEDVQSMMATVDTIETIDPETYESKLEIVVNEINVLDVKRFRLKEIWYFDEQHSVMKVRILGIAPIIDEYDDYGNFLYERPLFWIYYPHAREIFGREDVFVEGNDATRLSWENILEMRFFSSYIMKESNVLDARLNALYTGVDRLLESEKIKMQIFNFEHDLWSY